jgi:hypothetical protein
VRTTFLVAALLLGVNATEARAQLVAFGVGGPAGYSGFFGSTVDSLHVAGGAQFVVGDRLGVGGDLGFFSRLVTASAMASWHFVGVRAPGRAMPFVAGGYSKMGIGDGEGSFQAWVVAAGADVRLRKRWAVRLEFRDNVRPDARGSVQYWSIGAGVSFR